MPRLPIALEDYWTSNRLTELHRRSDWLGGCGISLDVWQTCFDFADGSWFACVEGADNLTLVSVRDAIAPARTVPFVLSAEALEEGEVSPLAARLGFGALNGEVLKVVGGDVRPGRIQVGSSVEAFLHLHDDCFFAVCHRSRDMLDVWLRAIIRVHEHYADVDLAEAVEAEVAARVRAVIESVGRVELRTDQVERSLNLAYRQPRDGRINRLLGRKRRVTEAIPLRSLS